MIKIEFYFDRPSEVADDARVNGKVLSEKKKDHSHSISFICFQLIAPVHVHPGPRHPTSAHQGHVILVTDGGMSGDGRGDTAPLHSRVLRGAGPQAPPPARDRRPPRPRVAMAPPRAVVTLARFYHLLQGQASRLAPSAKTRKARAQDSNSSSSTNLSVSPSPGGGRGCPNGESPPWHARRLLGRCCNPGRTRGLRGLGCPADSRSAIKGWAIPTSRPHHLDNEIAPIIRKPLLTSTQNFQKLRHLRDLRLWGPHGRVTPWRGRNGIREPRAREEPQQPPCRFWNEPVLPTPLSCLSPFVLHPWPPPGAKTVIGEGGSGTES